MCVDDCTTGRNNRQAGQVVPMMALVIMLVVVAVMALSRAGSALDDSARARTAADAAALAGAADGQPAAADMAEANGGELISFQSDGNTALVEVRVGVATAQARATATVNWETRSG